MAQKKLNLSYIRQFQIGILWTLFDAVGSQGLLTLFHFLYRSYAGTIEHGALGCIHSLLYLAVVCANVGLDPSIAPFLEEFSLSRKRFRDLLVVVMIPQALLLMLLSIIFFAYFQKIPYFLSFLSPSLSWYSEHLVLLLLFIFIAESIRKTMRTFLQLSFYFRYAAFIELLGISINVAGILVMQFTQTLTFFRTWQLMALSSCVQIAALGICIGQHYRSLSATSEDVLSLKELLLRFSKSRFFTWLLQCLNQLYSGNFLVPLCAIQFGIESASIMKIITSISSWITLITRKSLGVTSNAVLAHFKNQDSPSQVKMFQYLADIFAQSIYGLAIFLLINGQKILLLSGQAGKTITWSLLSAVLLVTLFESFFVLYEKWYIFEEDSKTYLLFNGISVIALYIALRWIHTPTTILLTIGVIRLSTFFLLSVYSLFRWHIRPTARPKIPFIATCLAISLITYLIL